MLRWCRKQNSRCRVDYAEGGDEQGEVVVVEGGHLPDCEARGKDETAEGIQGRDLERLVMTARQALVSSCSTEGLLQTWQDTGGRRRKGRDLHALPEM